MERKLSLEQLRKLAEERLMNKRIGKIRAVLGYSQCSVSVGANDVLRAMQLAATNIDDVIIETTGCIGLCSKEPIVEIYTPDGRKFCYEHVTGAKARAIIISHAMHGKPIEEWLLTQ